MLNCLLSLAVQGGTRPIFRHEVVRTLTFEQPSPIDILMTRFSGALKFKLPVLDTALETVKLGQSIQLVACSVTLALYNYAAKRYVEHTVHPVLGDIL